MSLHLCPYLYRNKLILLIWLHSSDFLDLRRRNQTPCGKKKLMRFQTEPEISRSCSLSLYTISVNELNILPWIDFTYLDTWFIIYINTSFVQAPQSRETLNVIRKHIMKMLKDFLQDNVRPPCRLLNTPFPFSYTPIDLDYWFTLQKMPLLRLILIYKRHKWNNGEN